MLKEVRMTSVAGGIPRTQMGMELAVREGEGKGIKRWKEEVRLGRTFRSLRTLDWVLKTVGYTEQLQIPFKDNFGLCV